MATRRRVGRPPAGPRGEKTSRYPVLTVRVPPKKKNLIESLAFLHGVGVSVLIDRAIDAYVKALPAGERRLATELAGKRS